MLVGRHSELTDHIYGCPGHVVGWLVLLRLLYSQLLFTIFVAYDGEAFHGLVSVGGRSCTHVGIYIQHLDLSMLLLRSGTDILL